MVIATPREPTCIRCKELTHLQSPNLPIRSRAENEAIPKNMRSLAALSPSIPSSLQCFTFKAKNIYLKKDTWRKCHLNSSIFFCNIFLVFSKACNSRIAYDRLYAYLEEHNIICKYQSGSRAIHSTVTALLEATDTWTSNIDRGKINAVVFLDLKKAFDTVDHEILLSKLSNYGIYGNAHQWFKSYLENRTQMCSINGSLSQSCLLSCGVPQGTILGPLLFLLYINDLPNCLSNCQPRMYVDDTHLTYAGDN